MKKYRMRHLCRWLQENLSPGGCTGTWQMVETWCRMHGLDAGFIKERAEDYCEQELLMTVAMAGDNHVLSLDTVIPRARKNRNEPQ